MKKLFIFLATGFGAGYSPVAPGTAGTLVAVPLVFLLTYVGPFNYMLVTLLSIGGAVFVSDWYDAQFAEHDRKEIVIDEIVGFFIAMTWVPYTWQAVVIAFGLFRFFDAVKPFPISWLDKRVKGGLGVVADDIAAGIITNIIMQVLYTQTDWLGVRLLE